MVMCHRPLCATGSNDVPLRLWVKRCASASLSRAVSALCSYKLRTQDPIAFLDPDPQVAFPIRGGTHGQTRACRPRAACTSRRRWHRISACACGMWMCRPYVVPCPCPCIACGAQPRLGAKPKRAPATSQRVSRPHGLGRPLVGDRAGDRTARRPGGQPPNKTTKLATLNRVLE